MKTLTIFTPVYNRYELLKRVYASLLCQTCKDFTWLIVDDGSSDAVTETVACFMSEGKIDVRYIKKENGGKHTALNIAFSQAQTELIMISLDSDDTLKPTAVETVLKCFFETEEKYNGYVFMKEDRGGKLMISHMSDELREMSWQKAVCDGYFDGEALLILKTEYAKRFSYPEIKGEKFFTEAYVFLQMEEPFLWLKESVYVAEYLDDGYTKNIMTSFRKNPVCYSMYNKLRLGLYKKNAKRFKYAAYYTAFSLLCKKKKIISDSGAPFLCVLAFPFGFAFYLLLKFGK